MDFLAPPFWATNELPFPMIVMACDLLRHETMMMIAINMITIIPSTPAIAPIIIGRGMGSSVSGGIVAVGLELLVPTEPLTPLTPLLIRSLILLVGLLVLLGCTVEGLGPPGGSSVEKGLS
jgi:hypothetical protein